MAVYKRPGVYISEAVLPDTVPVEDTATLSSLLGTLEKGPVTSTTLVNSWSEFVRNFGNLSPTYPTTFAAYHFFLNGGQNLLVNRLVSASAVAASRTLMDKAGTPLATLRVDAANPGTWGNDIYVAISDNTADAARFDLIVYYGGSTPDKVVEQYVGCSMDPMDPKYVVPFVSQPSRYVVLTNLNSATAAPTNRPAVLAVGANSRLGSGTGTTVAGTAGAGLTATEYDTALARYDTVPFSIDVNAPALTDTALLAKIINYAHKRGDMFVVVDPAANQDATTVTGTYGAGLVTAVKALPDTASGSSHAAIYAPWATIPDPLSVVPGQTRTIAPGGGILGLYARTDAVDGPEKAPAGVRATLRGVVAPEKGFHCLRPRHPELGSGTGERYPICAWRGYLCDGCQDHPPGWCRQVRQRPACPDLPAHGDEVPAPVRCIREQRPGSLVPDDEHPAGIPHPVLADRGIEGQRTPGRLLDHLRCQ
jgi:hypothetical protein